MIARPTLLLTGAAALISATLTLIVLLALSAPAPATDAALVDAGQPLAVMGAVEAAVGGEEAPAGPVLPVALTVYDAPGGAVLGDVEAGRGYAVVAQAHGGAWLQLEVAGSGRVWAEASAWGSEPIVRPAVVEDLTPP
jgi:hypothetical protein